MEQIPLSNLTLPQFLAIKTHRIPAPRCEEELLIEEGLVLHYYLINESPSLFSQVLAQQQNVSVDSDDIRGTRATLLSKVLQNRPCRFSSYTGHKKNLFSMGNDEFFTFLFYQI